jgi:undecaprenyl phosphate N,N'-diacetylbacillosamine 1-phosphate transferase
MAKLLAILLLLLLSPMLAFLMILIYINLGSPIFFKQRRIGKNEKVFNIIKFRSMTDKRHSDGTLLPDSERITRFGKFLRASSLDEIPELLNIIRGEMTFVGPRPLLEKYLPHYTEEEKKRHEVLPGITGLAQVSGRNSLSWEERLALDVEYVKNKSFSGDTLILLKTIGIVITKRGLSTDPRSQMEDLDQERSRDTE